MGAPGKDLPVTGNNPNADTYVFKRVNANTLEAQYKKAESRRFCRRPSCPRMQDADCHCLGTSAAGQAVNNVAVYDK